MPIAAVDDEPGRSMRGYAIPVGTTGVVSLGVGVVFGIRAHRLSNELSAPGAQFNREKYDERQHANTVAIVSVISGAVFASSAVVLYWQGYVLGHRHKRMTLAPLISAQAAGLAVTGLLP